MEVKTRNVNTAFDTLVQLFHTREYCGDVRPWEIHGRKAPIIERPSRNGPVIMIDEPVTITYERPTERVLFNEARDANSAFHLYESLWMLAGRNDVAPLAYYASRMKTFSDDGGTLNGAYGYRWRHAFNSNITLENPSEAAFVDQLRMIVAHLKADPTSRRAVLQMWNVEDDLLKIGQHPERSGNFYNPDLNFPSSKDVACNLSVLFSIRDTQPQDACTFVPCPKYLDMTVFNRSNDLIWGCLGANVVHFSVLQEYMAAQLGVEVGRYNQISNNLHVYLSNFKSEEWLAGEGRDWYEYGATVKNRVPLIKDTEAFDRQLPLIVAHFDGREESGSIGCDEITEPFLWDVVRPLLRAFSMHKRGRTEDAIGLVQEQCAADDWRLAAQDWFKRRLKKTVTA